MGSINIYPILIELFEATFLPLSSKSFQRQMVGEGDWEKRKPILMFYIYPSPNSSCISVAALSARAKDSSQAWWGALLSGLVWLGSSQMKQIQCYLLRGPSQLLSLGLKGKTKTLQSSYCKINSYSKGEKSNLCCLCCNDVLQLWCVFCLFFIET